jgi:hypothetical protein
MTTGGIGNGGGGARSGLLNLLLGGGGGGGGGDLRSLLGNAGAMMMMLDPMSRSAGTAMLGLGEERRAERTQRTRTNETAAWLQTQGVGPGEAAFLAATPDALNAWYSAWKTGSKPDWQFHEVPTEDGGSQLFLIDMKNPDRRQAVGPVKRPAPKDPMTVAPGNVVFDPVTRQPIYTAPKEPSPVTVAPGSTIFDPVTKQPIFTAPKPAEAPHVETFFDPATGREQKVQWDPTTGRWVPVGGVKAPSGFAIRTNPDGTVEIVEGGQKLSEQQSKLTLFKTLQDQTQPALLDLESDWSPQNIPDAAARATPIAGNYFTSQKGQIYKSLATVWAEATLRISTGQAATQPEIDRIAGAYFGVVGDTPDTVRYKAQLRALYTRAVNAALGQPGGQGKLPTPSEFLKSVNASPNGNGGDGKKHFRYNSNGDLEPQ